MTNHTSSDVPGTVPGTQPGIQTGTPVGTQTGTQTGTPVGGKPPLKDQAATVAADAGDAGRRVMDVAKDETKSVAEETRHQVRRLTDQVGTELREQAATQQGRAAQGLRSVGSDFSQMADGGAPTSGYANKLVRQAGRKADEVAQWLDARDPGDLLQEAKSFARRRPGVFLAIAVAAGIVAGRLTRALTAPDDEGGAVASGTSPRSARVPTAGVGTTGSAVPTGDTWATATPGLAGDRYTETPSVEANEYPDANEYPEGGGRR